TSVRAIGSTMESFPSAAAPWPAAITYNKLSSPTTANRAFAPVRGMESVVRTPQQSNDVNQLGPAGVEPTRLLLTTNTRVPTMATAWGYTPTATLVVSPFLKLLTRVTVFRLGLAIQAIESSWIAAPVAPDPGASGST